MAYYRANITFKYRESKPSSSIVQPLRQSKFLINYPGSRILRYQKKLWEKIQHRDICLDTQAILATVFLRVTRRNCTADLKQDAELPTCYISRSCIPCSCQDALYCRSVTKDGNRHRECRYLNRGPEHCFRPQEQHKTY
jgi:hypothetical protein